MLGDDVGGLRATALMSVMGSAAIDDQINPHLHLSAAFAGGEVFTTHLLNKAPPRPCHTHTRTPMRARAA